MERTFTVHLVEGGVPLKCWTVGVPFEDKAREQLERVARMPFISAPIAVRPDVHVGKGSTVGSYVLLQLKKNGKAPCAIINLEAEPIVAVGAIISGIPMVDMLEGGAYSRLMDGMELRVDGGSGRVSF